MEGFVGESGPDFEKRGLTLARALHDPMGTQGAVMFRGRERDGLFVGHDEIHAYEFTVLGSKEKAVKDGGKLAELLSAVGDQPGNVLKSRTGWFVTLAEPTAEQRTAVSNISKSSGERIHAISISTLHQRICNSELYIQARDNAPFGSIDFGSALRGKRPEVEISIRDASGDMLSVSQMAARLTSGNRALLVGNYGVGKSHTLRELYRKLRKEHFRRGKLTPFPIHINLRDCAGLTSPAEILRRHAEEIGFDHANGLISAWRAGACILLLDGFDEIVPGRWFGGANDLKTVRWQALNPVRRLIRESPANCGVIVAGRSHYFSGAREMLEALGLNSFEQFEVPDFDESQVKEFLAQAEATWELPDWVPVRPLLLGYLVSIQAEQASEVATAVTRATGWRKFLDAICERESEMVTAVRPETIRRIVARVATVARSRSDVTGPVSMDMLKSAYSSVNGVQPDEEGVQVLLRLPGLATTNPSSLEDSRVFADRDLAEAAYGLDLAEYAVSPYDETHPLVAVASWATAAGDLGIEVASDSLSDLGVELKMLTAALLAREKDERWDAVMADLIRVAAEYPDGRNKESRSFFVTGVYFEQLVVSDHSIFASTTFNNCVIEKLDLSGIDESTDAPRFQESIIGSVEGVASLPPWLESKFEACEISEFSNATQTTAGILQLGVDRESRIALTILKKVFGQRGSARKEGALSRGLSLNDRPLVPQVIDRLISQGWLHKSSSGNNIVYVGIKSRRKDAMHVLDAPADFKI
jgi:hypothetical protein